MPPQTIISVPDSTSDQGDVTTTNETLESLEWLETHDPEFTIVYTRVQELLEEADDEETGDVPPSPDAISDTLDLLLQTRPLIKGTFPRASASFDGEGGVYLYWMGPERSIQLTVPAEKNKPTFIYHRQGNEYGIEENVLAERLAHWLNWFAGI